MKIICKVGIVRIYLKKYKKMFKIGIRNLIIKGIFLPHPACTPITTPNPTTKRSKSVMR
jgi:hypothetical protein